MPSACNRPEASLGSQTRCGRVAGPIACMQQVELGAATTSGGYQHKCQNSHRIQQAESHQLHHGAPTDHDLGHDLWGGGIVTRRHVRSQQGWHTRVRTDGQRPLLITKGNPSGNTFGTNAKPVEQLAWPARAHSLYVWKKNKHAPDSTKC
jgi:hypothetical protein